MINKHLLFAGLSALMLASCSDDINSGGEDTPNRVENALNFKMLDPSLQSGRVSFPGETRGPKADRLQLVAKITPLTDADQYEWSATGIAFSGGTAYVSWHSDHQAQTPAIRWGGALDQISISALQNADILNVFTRTQELPTAKLNGVVANGSTLYFPMTCYNNGAVVGRMAVNSETVDTIAVPGSSVNAVAVEGSTVYAVSGYVGGAYELDFNAAEGPQFASVANIPVSETFGGKYIAGGYVLRTDDNASALVSLSDGTSRSLGAPLKSTEKYAEAYDPAKNEWYPLEGDKSAHFGKHTMAVSDGYIYVGGGKGADKKNGLRVYGSTGETPVWENGTNTTAVCVQGDYVYAATGAGLRVYKKYNASSRELELFAYEVKEYDNDGNAIGHTASTSGHSGNFVAVDPTTGLIFVAYGQSGVYVFRLDATIPDQPEIEPVTVTVTFKDGKDGVDIVEPIVKENVEPGTNVNIDAPEDPTTEGKEFLGWSTDPDATEPEYKKDKEIVITAGNEDTNVILYPVYKPSRVTVTWMDGYTDTSLKEETIAYGEAWNTVEELYPAKPTREGYTFAGWTVTVGGENVSVNDDYVVKSDVVVTANWTQLTIRTITFDGGKLPEGAPQPTGMPNPNPVTTTSNSVEIPAGEPECGKLIFCGWSTERGLDPATNSNWKDHVYRNKDDFKKTYTFAEGETEVTLYAIWTSSVIGGDGEHGSGTDE